MASTVSNINALQTGSSSDAFMGATSTGTVSTDSGFTASAFQGELDKAMQRGPDMEGTGGVGTVAEGPGEVGAIAEGAGEVGAIAEGAGEVGAIAEGPGEVGAIAEGAGEVGAIAEGPGEVGAIAEGPGEVGAIAENTTEGSGVVEETGVNLSEDTSTQTEPSPLATAQKPNLSTGKNNTEISTVDKSRLIVRRTKQKISDIEDALENGGSTEFLTELKNMLLSLSNNDLANLSLDEDGLEALGDLLVQAGFDQASVEELMSDLTLTLEEGDGLISVSGFMDNLFELPLAEDEDITQAEALMPTSDLPYIKSLLSMMGVDEQEITSIMDKASQGTRGFDFDTFIEKLEQLWDTADKSGLTYQTDTGNDAYMTLLEQLDLDSFIEKPDAPLTLATIIDAFTQKRNLIEDNPVYQTEQFVSDMLKTDSFDALATRSGRHGLLNQLLSGLNIQENREETVDSSIRLSTSSNAMIKEIKDRIQVQFMDQVSRGDVRTKTAGDTQTAGNTVSADIQTGETGLNDAFKIANNSPETAGTTRESASQIAIKAARADAALEKIDSTSNFQPGDTTSKSSETQPLVFGVEKSIITANVENSGSQRTQQAFSTLPDFVTRQVGKSIVRSINTGDDTIRMQLKPPELGRVYMSIDHNGSSMKVSVITENQSAKDILTASVNEIRTMLSASGINLESFEVDMSTDFRQSMADARSQNQSAKKQQAKSGAHDDAQEDGAEHSTVQSPVMNGRGSLHFVA